MNATRRRLTRSSKQPVTRLATPAAAAPDVIRLSRVRTALQRISSGYYDRDEVRDRLATAVLHELQKM